MKSPIKHLLNSKDLPGKLKLAKVLGLDNAAGHSSTRPWMSGSTMIECRAERRFLWAKSTLKRMLCTSDWGLSAPVASMHYEWIVPVLFHPVLFITDTPLLKGMKVPTRYNNVNVTRIPRHCSTLSLRTHTREHHRKWTFKLNVCINLLEIVREIFYYLSYFYKKLKSFLVQAFIIMSVMDGQIFYAYSLFLIIIFRMPKMH